MDRLVNFIFALIVLVLFAPVMLLTALVIRLDSPGSALFRQRRVGMDNTYFILYKFRTMQVGMPDLPSEMVSGRDPRITRVGHFLRRVSLDELPQLFNIIRGEMNFIGPRPALYNQDKLIAMRTEAGINRLKPGVTGWAQVNGRDNIPLERKVELEKYYLRNKSFYLNLIIIWLTLAKSLAGADIYGEKNENNLEGKKDNTNLPGC